MTSQLDTARAALAAAREAEQEARATHRSLSADLSAAQQQAVERSRFLFGGGHDEGARDWKVRCLRQGAAMRCVHIGVTK